MSSTEHPSWRRASPEDRRRHRNGVSIEELRVLVATSVAANAERKAPSGAQFYVQVATPDDEMVGVIRGIDVRRERIYVDFGFHEQYWMEPSEVVPFSIRWNSVPVALEGRS